ncbi:MAG: hypothetical protein KatS3mg105_0269 [Gemmatales bacterium]|nr:MAG: hypothetical protein KatS3mg105_0269 [Gemmatales bacterium]
MRIANFVTIIGLAWAMSAYAAWVRHEREKRFDLRGDTTKQLPLVRLQEAKTLWHRPHTIFVDVRSAAEFRQGHIAGRFVVA